MKTYKNWHEYANSLENSQDNIADLGLDLVGTKNYFKKNSKSLKEAFSFPKIQNIKDEQAFENYLAQPQLKPTPSVPFYEQKISPKNSEKDLVEEALKYIVKKGYHTFQYGTDVIDDIYYKLLTAEGNLFGSATADMALKLAGKPVPPINKNDYLGTIWSRKPFSGRGYSKYMAAKERGENPSEWYAHYGDIDGIYNIKPKSTAGKIIKDGITEFMEIGSPSNIIISYLTGKVGELGTNNLGKYKQLGDRTLDAATSLESAANKLYKYRD